MVNRIHLDHAATTPIVHAARAAMIGALESWANPSSPHSEGRAARRLLEDARGYVAACFGAHHRVIFTSGASEALAIALARGRPGPRLISAVEHDAVRRAAPDASVLPVDADGIVSLDGMDPMGLVAVQHVNNETGVIQPIEDVADRVHEAGGLLLVDAAQSAGRIDVPDADFIALSAHKLGGPPGVGALLVRDPAHLAPTGGQEQGYRQGTENLPAILGFAAALKERREWMARAAELRDHLDKALVGAGGVVVAGRSRRLPSIGSYRMPGVPAASQIIQFDLAGIAVSAGSACSSGSLKPSHVLAAMGWEEGPAREVIRVSFGPATTRAEIYEFVRVWTHLAASAKERAA